MPVETSETKQKVSLHTLLYKGMPHKMNYGIMYTIDVNNNVDTIKYEASVQCLEIFPNNNAIFLINRTSKTYINDVEPELIADILATKVAEVLYPMLLKTNDKGKILSIQNFQAIKERWAAKQQEILTYYQGELVEKYLHLTGLSLQDENVLLHSLSTDWFLCTYFNTIYQHSVTTAKTEKWVSFPLLGKSEPVVFKATQSIEEHYTEDNLLQLNIKGELADERCKADLENELNFPYFGMNGAMPMATGSYRAQYYLDPVFYAVDMAYLECEIELEEKKRVTVLIASLNAPKYKVTNENNYSFATEEVIEKKRKSFWQTLKIK
jgi:hypothetical protein